MRFAIACALGALLVAGCSAGADMQLSSAQLSGTVYEIDGQNADLAGVEVTLAETGERARTDDGGAFSFAGLAPGVYTLEFDRSLVAAAMLEEEPAGGAGEAEDVFEEEKEGGHEDEFEDGEGNPKVEVPADGGDIEVRVALDGDDVKDISVGSHEDRVAMARLHMTDQAELEGFRLGGGVKLIEDDGRERFKVCVEGLAPGDVIEIFLGIEPPQSIGTATAVAEEGDFAEACFVRDTGEGQDLPLGAPNLDELAGMRIEVRLAMSDLVLMVGEVPHLPDLTEPPGKDDEAEEPGHDGEDGEHAEEPNHEGEEADCPEEPSHDGEAGEPEGDGEEPNHEGEGEEASGGEEEQPPPTDEEPGESSGSGEEPI